MILMMLTCSFLSVLHFRYAGDQTYFDEIKQFYYRDEFSHQVQEWNRQRTLAIERSLTQFLYPQMAKELKSKLIVEAKESIVRVIHHVSVYCNVTQMCQRHMKKTRLTMLLAHGHQNSKHFPKTVNRMYFISVQPGV